MGSSEALIRATVNRISARLGHGFADAAAELAVLAQDAPQRLRQEWDLFQDEVRAEAERIERGDQATASTDGGVGLGTLGEPTGGDRSASGHGG